MALPGLLRVPPTRSALLRLQRRRGTLLGACDLLERKRQVLAQKVVELLPPWEELREQACTQLAEAFRSFTVTRIRCTAGELRQLVGGMPPLVGVRLHGQPLSGVPTFTLDVDPVPLRPRFGLLGSTAELDRTILLLRDATATLARFATLQATLRSLALALHKTNRQVHTLRDRLLPLYEATVRFITETLEEQERNYLFQLKRIR